ncbi:hypothetical protein P22_0244 [Propionispora sp. 2/2-37]|uniref:thioredoxin n=1 Tax=Propionispora sp. 2/2-37 TaxID=1677858 RepID=UPI0006BB7424|nr:thioredoxin [Propionispora sp. 2/2-37]CUH94178.1 hypothetical protein P22_0244 [Propionispora sp. 2/2-37]
MSVVNISNQTEFSSIINTDKPVLVDFWAAWCGPCKMVAPEIEAVAQAYDGKAVIAKVNIDEQGELAGQYNVMSIPTVLVFKNGQEVTRLVGYRPRKEFSDALDKVL